MKKSIFTILMIMLFPIALIGCSSSNSNNSISNAHTHSYSTTVVEATCSSEGYTYHYCSGCGDEYKDNVVKALGHNYIEREQNYKCSECGRYEDEGFTFENVNGSYYVKSVSSKAIDGESIIIPRKHMGLAVTGILRGALYNVRNSMKELIIPSNIKYIGSLLVCYDGQYNSPTGTIVLETIKFDNSCSNINISHTAFQFCKNVNSISMSSGCISMINHDDSIGNHFLFEDTIFYKNNRTEQDGCYYLFDMLLETDKSKIGSVVTVKNGTRIIANQAFKENTNIKTVELPSSLIYIGKRAFARCVSLSTIIYHGTESQFNLITIESNSFEDCKTITYQFSLGEKI